MFKKKNAFDLDHSAGNSGNGVVITVPGLELQNEKKANSYELADSKAGHEPEAGLEVPTDATVEEENERKGWGGQIEFVLTVVGYAVGLGNVWRFPYLCYKNGGGAFLIPYVISLVFIGMPLFFLETSFGQFASLGPLTIWSANQLFTGLGVGMVMVSWLMSLYYIIIISWSLYYFFASMTSQLPWTTCGNSWNTLACFTKEDVNMYRNLTSLNYTFSDTNDTAFIEKFNRTAKDIKTPAEEYFYGHVLELSPGIEYPGTVRWQLALTLLLAWVVVYLVLIKGIRSLGKVAYFSSLFPYVILTIMLVRGATLPGAIDGIKYYMVPDFNRLSDATVWSDAAVQIFFSLSCCSGGLIAMASYNKFKNNVMRDAIMVPIINCLTSIYAGFVIFSLLGYMAKEKGVEVKDVATDGPGLVFVVYPEGLATMDVAPLWAILFFFMMSTLGFSSQFANVECVFSSLSDEFPQVFRGKSRSYIIRAVGCIAFYLLGLPMITQGGFYLFNLCDSYVGGFPLLILGLAEFLVICYAYGYCRYAEDVKMMVGISPGPFFAATWCVIAPILLIAIIVFKAIQYKPPTFGSYVYPGWAEAVAWLMVVACVVWIPFFFLVFFCRDGGCKLLNRLTKPLPEWGPAKQIDRTGRYANKPKTEIKHPAYDNPAYKSEVNALY